MFYLHFINFFFFTILFLSTFMTINSIVLFSQFSNYSNNRLLKKKAKRVKKRSLPATSLVEFYRKDFSFLDFAQGYIRKSYFLYPKDRNYQLRKNKKRVLSFRQKIQNLAFDIIIVYIRLKRRNTFTAVARWERTQANLANLANSAKYVLLHKLSAGLVGYLNNKKHTRMAQETVASTTGEYVKEQKATFVDIVFPTKMSIRSHLRFLKNMIKAKFFVRYIIAVKRRNYGIHRGKKARRV